MKTSLEVRPLESSDIPHILKYWGDMADADYERMGADRSKFPPPDKFRAGLEKIIATPDKDKVSAYMIWFVGGRSIGYSSLKNIQYGESGEMHLHIWDASVRGKGYGPILFAKSALEFYRRFSLSRIKCEPRVSNPFPNKMLRKIGFPLVRTHTAASSDVSIVCELNEYAIKREIAEAYLKQTPVSSSLPR